MHKIYTKSVGRIQRFLQNSWMQRGLALFLILLILQTVFVVRSYQISSDYLKANDPRKMQNRSEVSVYFSPFKIYKGMNIKIEEIVNYLKELSYLENSEEIAGTYSVNENEIKIHSRLPEFPNLKLIFAKKSLEQIFINEQPVSKAEIEPLPMQNFVQFIGYKKAKELRTRQTVLAPGSVPPLIVDAITSAEDNRFFEHFGLDWLGMMKRGITSRFKAGGSGITQQLIKNNVIQGSKDGFWQTYIGFLSPKSQRKIMEIPFSLAANDLMSKDEILAAYLSMVPMGASNGIENNGFVAATQEYFGKTLDTLSLAEVATLAGMVKQPSNYLKFVRSENYCSPESIKANTCANLIERRNAVLELMKRNHPDRYSPEMIKEAKATPLSFVFSSSQKTARPADAYSRLFADYAAQMLPENLGKLRNGEVNFRLFTTLDAQLQKKAMEIAAQNLARLQPKLETTCKAQTKGKIDCSKIKLQTGIVAIEPQTGAILTMVGGVNTQFNFAVSAKRSPASAVKPFYYLTAIESGFYNGESFTATTILDPSKDILNTAYLPTGNIGQRASVRTFLAKSWNFGAVAAANSVGIERSIKLYARLTRTNPEKTEMSAIGGTAGSETDLLTLTNAYSIFPNEGNFVEVNPFRSISRDGQIVPLQAKLPQRVATQAGTFILNSMLSSVVEPGGTAGNFRQKAGLSKDLNFAGKTGSGMGSDLWFIGYSPKLLVGVWVGVPNNEIKLYLENGWSGGTIASNIASDYIHSVAKFRPELLQGKFIQPSNVIEIPVDNTKGCQLEDGNQTELFILGRLPNSCN